jgi:hypothetical protein
MKQSLFLLLALFISAILFTSTSKIAKVPEISTENTPIEELLLANKVQIKIKGMPDFNAQCLSFSLTNLTSDTVCIILESGNKLMSNNADHQDFYFLKSDIVCLEPHQTKLNSGHVFYYKNLSSSLLDEEKNTRAITAENWRKLSEVIDAHDYPIHVIQAAIWCITDNHPVSSIYSEDNKNIQLLRRTVTEIQKDGVPWYYVTYYEDTTVLYSNKYKNVIGNIEFYVPTSSIITINIRNRNNEVMSTLIKESSVGPGNHKFSLNVSVSSWTKGEYIVFVYEDYSKVIARKTFEL